MLRVPAGSLALLAAARAGTPLPPLGTDDEAVLAVRDGDGATLEPLDPALATLLETAATPQPRTTLCALARRLGAAPEEDAEIVDGLAADGLLA
ncbi:MAG: hypothetical protein KIT14_22825 [bacterium]|nr:hypothetical protein [bacterium]